MNTDQPTPDVDSTTAPEAVPAPPVNPPLSLPALELPATEPSATEPAAPTPPAAESSPQERLEALAAQAAQARLKAEEEEEAARLLQAMLASGGAGLGTALTYLIRFNWNVTVQALNAAWPEMSATAKEALVSGLKRDEFRTEAARRVRLSLARGLFKQDAEAAAKIIGGVCAELRKVSDEEPLTKSERRNFDSVMIGKGRPWICQIPLAEWRAAESNPVVQVAIAVCFSGNVPPFSQLSMLKWLSDGGRLEKLPEDSLALVTEAIARWSGKWKGALLRELPNLPEPVSQAAAVPEPARVEPVREAKVVEAEEVDEEDDDDDEEDDEEDEAEEDSDEESEEGDEEDGDDSEDEEEDEDEDEEEDADGESDEGGERASGESEGGGGGQRISRRERFRQRRQQRAEARAAAAAARGGGSKEPANGESGGRSSGRTPDFREALRLVERHYLTLKTELEVARANLRQRGGGGSKRRRDFEHEPDLPESEQVALRQHNVRLEATVAELRERVEALTAAAEDEATSREAFVEGRAPGEKEQFLTLLGLKLARAKADFEATHGRLRDDVFGDNYRTMLENIFGVLAEQGVVFPRPEDPPESAGV